MFVVATGEVIDAVQECTARTTGEAVVVRRIDDADLNRTRLCHGGNLVADKNKIGNNI